MFVAKLYTHDLLPTGELRVPAVITIRNDGTTISGAAVNAAELVFGGIVDCSGSMKGPKIVAARDALRGIVAGLPANAYFFLIAGGGNDETKTVFPLQQATDANKAAAMVVISEMTARWNTHISGWIDAAAKEFAKRPNGIKRGLLLTDGQNQENDKNRACLASVARCKGQFQLDCRGVGDDWDVELLTATATGLLGTVDVIKSAADMDAEFKAVLAEAAGKSISDVRVRFTCPVLGTKVESFKQMAPTMSDLTAQGTCVPNANGAPGLIFEFPTGAWGKEEVRDYQVAITLGKAGTPGGQRLMAGRVAVVVRHNGVEEVVKLDNSAIGVGWTDNEQQSVLRMPPELTRYGKEGALVQRMQQAIAAKDKGDLATATKLLGEANVLAEDLGNEGTKKLIRDVAVVDERTKRVTGLRTDANGADWIAAGTRSVRTKVLDGK